MHQKATTLQQRFEREFDPDRFRVQLQWLIEHRTVVKKGRTAKRTNKSIVAQIKAQHPGFDISETHFGNLVSGKRLVNVTLQLALYIAQVFDVANLDFFLDTDVERQRRMLLEPTETLQRYIAIYDAMEQQARQMGEGVLTALRSVPSHDLATLQQLTALRAKPDEIALLTNLRALSPEQRAVFEQLIRGLATGSGGTVSAQDTK